MIFRILIHLRCKAGPGKSSRDGRLGSRSSGAGLLLWIHKYIYIYRMRLVTGSGEVRQVSPDYRCWVRPVSPNLSFPGIQRRINSRLRHVATCCDMFFMSFFSLVKTGVHHILQDMDVTGAGALRSTISRPSENDDGEREWERERSWNEILHVATYGD